MKITFEVEEIGQMYDFVQRLNSKDANRVFNALFTEDHVEQIKVSVDNHQKQLTLEIDKEISGVFLDTFIGNASNISSLFGSSKVSLLCNAKSVFDKLSRDIKNSTDIVNKLWRRKKLECTSK